MDYEYSSLLSMKIDKFVGSYDLYSHLMSVDWNFANYTVLFIHDVIVSSLNVTLSAYKERHGNAFPLRFWWAFNMLFSR